MAKPDLGTKRTCTNCGARFYDLNKSPIVCPKCDTVFNEAPRPQAAPARAAPAAAAAAEPAPAAEEAAAEVVSLEDAEKEQTAGARKEPAGDEDFEIEDDTISDDEDDESFLEDDEDEDDDVTGIIGGGLDADEED